MKPLSVNSFYLLPEHKTNIKRPRETFDDWPKRLLLEHAGEEDLSRDREAV